ncbi:UNVERIFIED_CONTAM: hypothetical protein GTU68_062266 [Idotea baltica]|nr:hypothetical protein [Idotea baltica]
MLQIKQIEGLEGAVKERFGVRNLTEDQYQLFDEVLGVNDKRKRAQQELDQANADNKVRSAEIQALYKNGKKDEGDRLRELVIDQKDRIKSLEDRFRSLTDQVTNLLLQIPNLPHTSVPPGLSDADNVLFKEGPVSMPTLPKGALPHWDLISKYDIVDFPTATKIAGAGFVLYKGKGARLQRALINFFLDEAEEAGYLEVLPPHLVNAESAMGTGSLPDKEGQMYHVTADDLYLIPTSEIPVTNIFRGDIVAAENFPIKMTAYSPCFRREAGSYGAHVKGLNRVHQFDKVEIVQIAHPDQSYEAQKEMVAHVEGLLVKLGLPYRIVQLCGGDLTFASALTYDFEVFSAAQEKWLEVSSVSNFETYQSNRMKIRYRDEKGKTQLAHTLNGSALALARIFAAIVENYQTSDGIDIPEVLRPYTGFDKIV